jgi:hypothetical protein
LQGQNLLFELSLVTLFCCTLADGLLRLPLTRALHSLLNKLFQSIFSKRKRIRIHFESWCATCCVLFVMLQLFKFFYLYCALIFLLVRAFSIDKLINYICQSSGYIDHMLELIPHARVFHADTADSKTRML